jgi:hypothetical protein
LALAAEREQQQLLDSSHRMTDQQRMSEALKAANEDYAIKQTALSKEITALDKGGKDYENKLRQLQDKEKQLTQQHTNEITAIKNKADIEQNQKQQAAMARMVDGISGGLTQVLMRHQSFAAMMDSIGNQVVSGMMQTALKSMMTMDMDKEKAAGKAARDMFLAGAKFPFPANIVMAPALCAMAFASMMAFQDGGVVPGIGRGDTVPAMLEPGEGVIPGGVMDGLRSMARSGSMGGGSTYHAHVNPTYHLQALDASGMDKVLDKHSDTLQKHVTKTLRKMNG